MGSARRSSAASAMWCEKPEGGIRWQENSKSYELREARALTQEQLAETLGITPGYGLEDGAANGHVSQQPEKNNRGDRWRT
jgi:hypothetical protein